jgi:hypothetical protein
MPIPPTDADFPELNALRRYLERLLELSVPSLAIYWDASVGGFAHNMAKPKRKELSPASTATCISYLVHSNRWKGSKGPWGPNAQALADRILAPGFEWKSGGLDKDNAFTSSFLLQAISDLRMLGVTLTVKDLEFCGARLDELEEMLVEGQGVSVLGWPGSAFLTYKVVRSVESWRVLTKEAKGTTATWAWNHLTDESVGLSDGWPDSDVHELIYSAMLASRCTIPDQMSEKRREALEFSVGQFFAAQTERGRWPLSRPLFLYPDFGMAYSYDYEVLSYLMNERSLAHLLHRHLSALRRAANSLDDTKVELGDEKETRYGWATGHLKSATPPPESWSTASAYHFCFSLHRLVAEAIRRTAFAYANVPYSPPRREVPLPKVAIDRKAFLDSDVVAQGHRRSLRGIVEKEFLVPLRSVIDHVKFALSVPKDVPTGAILFGPPGTSKTELARIVAEKLGWPLLRLDPSHLTRRGMDQLHAETNHVLSMLAACEEMVVLFDEFDELVRDRDSQGTESISRFLTTAMLPKLTALSDRRRIVYLLATNHVERFDPAIRRRGRFDMIVPVMPPTYWEKIRKWPEIKRKLSEHDLAGTNKDSRSAKEAISDLTFDECKDLEKLLKECTSKQDVLTLLKESAAACTLRQEISPETPGGTRAPTTWKAQLAEQQKYLRIPPPPASA